MVDTPLMEVMVGLERESFVVLLDLLQEVPHVCAGWVRVSPQFFARLYNRGIPRRGFIVHIVRTTSRN